MALGVGAGFAVLFVTLLVFLGTVAFSAYLFIIIPKGLFPAQDNGIVSGITEARQDISFKEMVDVQQRLADIIQQDPDTAAFVSSMGGGFAGATNNQGRLFIAHVGMGAVWVANEYGGSVSRIDPATDTARTIMVGNRPHGIAVAGGLVWVGAQPAATSHRGG